MCPSLEILRLISFKAAASVTDRIRRAVADTAELGLLVRYLPYLQYATHNISTHSSLAHLLYH